MASPHGSDCLAAQHDELSSSRGQPSRHEGRAVSKKPALKKPMSRKPEKKANGSTHKESNGRDKERESPQGPMTSTSSDKFTRFSKLPLELQRKIWSIAAAVAQVSSARVFHVAPDPKYWSARLGGYRLEEIASEDAQFRILRDKQLTTPSLLTVCREARLAARKEYLVWPLAHAKSFGSSRGAAYINKTYDTIYLGDTEVDDLWFVELLSTHRELDVEQSPSALAFRKYLDQLRGIENLAMHSSNWDQLLYVDRDLRWLRQLPSLRMLTIVLSDEQRKLSKTNLVVLQPIKVSTPGEIWAKEMSAQIRKSLDEFQVKFPDHSILQLDTKEI